MTQKRTQAIWLGLGRHGGKDVAILFTSVFLEASTQPGCRKHSITICGKHLLSAVEGLKESTFYGLVLQLLERGSYRD